MTASKAQKSSVPKSKKKLTPELAYKAAAKDGLTQDQIAYKWKLSRPYVSKLIGRHCKIMHLPVPKKIPKNNRQTGVPVPTPKDDDVMDEFLATLEPKPPSTLIPNSAENSDIAPSELPDIDMMRDAALKIAWKNYRAEPTPQWFKTITDYLEEQQEKNRIHSKGKIPRYRRPEILTEKQNKIIDDFINDDRARILFLQGGRRTGKSTIDSVLMIEFSQLGYMHQLMYGPTNDSAETLMHQMFTDIITAKEFDPLIAYLNKRNITFINGASVKACTPILSQSKGFKGELIVCDEFDQMARKQPKMVRAILGIVRENPNFKMVLSANNDKANYRVIRDVAQKMAEDPELAGMVQYVTLEKIDAPYLNNGNDRILRPLIDALSCDNGAYTREQFDGLDTNEGDLFPMSELFRCYEGYNDFVLNLPVKTYKVYIGVDPGLGHDTGCIVIGAAPAGDGFFWLWELESYSFSTDDVAASKFSDFVFSRVREIYESHLRNPKVKRVEIYTETNSLGGDWLAKWKAAKLYAYPSNFANKESKRSAKVNFIAAITNHIMGETPHLFLRNDLVKLELSMYDLDKKDEMHKGNVADALFHAVYRAVGGYNFFASVGTAGKSHRKSYSR